MKKATHTTSVPLYSGRAMIVRVSTRALSSSLSVPRVISVEEFRPTEDPFTFQPMAKAAGCRHRNTAVSPTNTSCEDGISVKPTIDAMHAHFNYYNNIYFIVSVVVDTVLSTFKVEKITS